MIWVFSQFVKKRDIFWKWPKWGSNDHLWCVHTTRRPILEYPGHWDVFYIYSSMWRRKWQNRSFMFVHCSLLLILGGQFWYHRMETSPWEAISFFVSDIVYTSVTMLIQWYTPKLTIQTYIFLFACLFTVYVSCQALLLVKIASSFTLIGWGTG